MESENWHTGASFGAQWMKLLFGMADLISEPRLCFWSNALLMCLRKQQMHDGPSTWGPVATQETRMEFQAIAAVWGMGQRLECFSLSPSLCHSACQINKQIKKKGKWHMIKLVNTNCQQRGKQSASLLFLFPASILRIVTKEFWLKNAGFSLFYNLINLKCCPWVMALYLDEGC